MKLGFQNTMTLKPLKYNLRYHYAEQFKPSTYSHSLVETTTTRLF